MLDPDGQVTPDFGERLPGRGAWVSATRKAVETAAAKGSFARAFRTAARLPAEMDAGAFAGEVEAGLLKRMQEAIGLARRQGALVAGFEKVKAAFKSGRGGVLITASEAGPDGVEKLGRLAAGAPIVRLLAGAELSAAIGEAGVVHAAALKGAAADRIAAAAARLEGFRPGSPGGA